MGRIHDALRRAEQERARREQSRAEVNGVSPPVEPPIRSFVEPRVADLVPATPRKPASPPPRTESGSVPRRAEPNTDRSRVSAVPARPRTQAPPADPLPLRPPEVCRSAFMRVPELAPSARDAYRGLVARIQSMRRQRSIRSLVITSARPAEGKTTTAVHLARSYRQDPGHDLCLVDLDLRLPNVHHAAGSPLAPGVVDLLEGTTSLDQALLHVPGSRLYLLPAGHARKDPSELLSSLEMARLVAELHQRFGLVLVDSPPLLGPPDTTEIVDLFDAVLLVVAAGATTVHDIDDAFDRIDGEKLVGTVLNRDAEPPFPLLPTVAARREI